MICWSPKQKAFFWNAAISVVNLTLNVKLHLIVVLEMSFSYCFIPHGQQTEMKI